MRSSVFVRVGAALAMAAAAVVGTPSSASPPDAVLDFPAGQVCAGFGLHVEARGTSTVTRDFTDKSGATVRSLAAGRGSALTFVNTVNSHQLWLKSNGAVSHTTVGPNGINTVEATGHNVVFMFPTDIPPGPSTTLYVGRVVFTYDRDLNFTILSTSGQAIDICAAVA